MSVHALLDRLEGVRKTGADRWIARCPAHEDRGPSLSIRELSDGRILVHDFGQQCSAGEIVAALGLELADLFPPRAVADDKRPPRERQPFSAADALRLIAAEVDRAALLIAVMAKHDFTPERRQRLLQAASSIRLTLKACGLREVA